MIFANQVTNTYAVKKCLYNIKFQAWLQLSMADTRADKEKLSRVQQWSFKPLSPQIPGMASSMAHIRVEKEKEELFLVQQRVSKKRCHLLEYRTVKTQAGDKCLFYWCILFTIIMIFK